MVSLVVGALSGVGAMAWTGARGLGLPAAILAGLYFCLVAAVQEAVFRGWGLSILRRRVGFWGAAIITSIIFAAIHAFIPDQNGMALLAMGLFGLAMCAAVRRLGTLWWAMGLHAGWDFMLTPVFGFGAAPGQHVVCRLAPQGPVWLSGGAAGPEASAITLAMLGCLFGALVWRSDQPGGVATSR
jgi:membrane protease YdiL (CAAX protease family)